MLKLAAYVQTFLYRFDREEGQTMAEYAVVLSVLVIAIVVALTYLSGSISAGISSAGSKV